MLWTCNTHHYHIQDKSQVWENNRIKTSIQWYEENELEWFLVINHKCYVLKKFSNVFLWCNLLFCFTWYDMTYWMCSRHWMWKLITLVWSGKSALPGHLPLQKSGVVVSAHWQSGYWPVAPSGQRSSVVNDDWHGASLSMPSLNWIRNHAGEVVTSNGGGRGSSRKVPSSVRGQGGLLFLNKSDLKVLNTKGGGDELNL